MLFKKIFSEGASQLLKNVRVTNQSTRRTTHFFSPQSKRNSSSESEVPSDVATIIQGPSLLTNTNVYRPSPSMFYLPGLRSLPFWTAPNEGDPSKIRVAYGDP